jgi:DNA-directed RNA polymerase subunit M/transcription elongation factor TFIIS
MPISFSCGKCGKKLKAPDHAAGKTSKCPGCGAPVTCPEPVYEAEPIQPEQPDVPEILDDPYGDDDGTPYGVAEPVEPLPRAEARRPCPMCGEMILANAAKCRFCGEVFDEGLKKSTTKKKKKKKKSYSAEDENPSGADWVAAILCANIGCILGIVYMIQGKPKGLKVFGISMGMQVVWFIVAFVLQIMNQQQGVGP